MFPSMNLYYNMPILLTISYQQLRIQPIYIANPSDVKNMLEDMRRSADVIILLLTTFTVL